MAHFDVFNGDADGLCALQQLRLCDSRDSILVTGVKRDVCLLGRVPAAPGDTVTVLDIGFDQNRLAAERLLSAGVGLLWIDHHHAGPLPDHPGIEAFIDEDCDTCTAMLIDRRLEGRYRPWAVVAAFGDGMADSANRLGAGSGFLATEMDDLAEIGEVLNYNAYGETIDDLCCHPAELAQAMRPFVHPLEFAAASEVYRRVRQGFIDDLERSEETVPLSAGKTHRVLLLPDEPWARRISGVLASRLGVSDAQMAIAVLTCLGDGSGYRVSVRVPGMACTDAGAFCRAFPSGGGRRTAAGINRLPIEDLPRFLDHFVEIYGESWI